MVERFTRVPPVREIENSNPTAAKSYTALQTIHHRFNTDAGSSVAMAL